MLSLFSKEKKEGNKKIVENLVLFLVLFIIVIVVINSLGEQKSTSSEPNSVTVQNITSSSTEKTLEEKLEDILSLIDGAGKVNVLITYSNGMEQVPIYDIKQNSTVTEESDKSGGTRKTEENSNEQSVVFSETGNTKTPVISQTINPEIVGVLVVADGANNLSVKENLLKAVEGTLNVAAHRVQVFARKK